MASLISLLAFISGAAALADSSTYVNPLTTTVAPITASSISTYSSAPSTTPSGNCAQQYDACTSSGSSFALCRLNLSSCENSCDAQEAECEEGPDAVETACQASYTSCIGLVPTYNASSSSSSTVSSPTPIPSSSCAQQYNACTSSGSSFALCRLNLSSCESSCNAQKTACEEAPDANGSTCQSLYISCIGPVPVYNSSSSSITSTPTPTPSVSCGQQYNICASSGSAYALCRSNLSDCENSCAAQKTACEQAPNSNKSTCQSLYISCLGDLPVYKTGSSSTPVTVVTTVVTSFTTFCPDATTVTCNSQTYTVSSATTLTITDCPCTITTSALVTPLVSASGSGFASVAPSWSPSGAISPPSSTYTWPAMTTSSSPAQYTGAASRLGAEGSVMLAAAAFLLI